MSSLVLACPVLIRVMISWAMSGGYSRDTEASMIKIQRYVVGGLVVLLMVSTTFVAGLGVGHYVLPSHDKPLLKLEEEQQQQFRVFWEAWRIVQERFYTEVELDSTTLTHGAIRGMVQSLGDRHTVFLEPSQADLFRQDLEGQFTGIGATVSMTDEGLVRVTKPLPGSPAEKAGLDVGDLILKVDDKPVQGLDLVEVIMLIRGPAQTEVRLLMLRLDGTESEVTIRRAVIELPTTETRVLDQGIAYLALSECNARAPREVTDGLRQLLASHPPALILDLRGNPGGYLHVAKEVASQFLADGLVLIERSSDGTETEHKAQAGGQATEIPLVVLVDAGTASAAEIIAGAIQDQNRGILVGEQTFGKGSVQTTERLSDGSALQLTIRRWYTPNGRQIQGEGLSPDVSVQRTEEDILAQRDPQLDRAIAYLSAQTAQ
jgi:carboxyl-terminal processing protease